ncbi:MAG TPA: hypothetical protein VGY90_09100 [Steroidobacteraceae bacterium]|jgi:hypothetical protein|nr:hypothetical protein [Steroidobacteraceae bacterium]
MEAASRPPLEALPDLPVEAPLDPAKVRAEPAAAPSGVAAAEAAKPKDPGQTGLNFVDPEMFFAPGQAASAVPVANAAGETSQAAEPALELELEDPVVDDMLTAPPPPAPPPPVASPAPAAALKPTSAESPAEAAAARAAARVPIAKTASLTAAATKLAAASGVARPGSTRKPAAAPAPGAAPVTNGEAAAKAAAPATKPTPAATTAKPETPAAKLDAPSLASWASARAAAAHKVRPAASPSGTASAPAPPTVAAKPGSPRPAAAAAPAAAATSATPATPAPPAAAATTMPTSPPMDRDFIARNQVVERYLSGRLPLKAATEFERFCRDHAEMLDQIGLPERVNAGLRLLEAAGKPEPWQEASRPVWQKPQVTLVLAVAVVVLGMALAGIGASNSSKSHRIAELQKQNTERALDPATSTREIRLLPSRSGASNSPAIIIGGGSSTQLVDLKIDESRSPYHAFRITIDRIDQGRVAVINNIDKDSNGHLRIALNSSALGPGNYQLTLEGLDWRGQPQPDSWVTIGIQR